MRRNSPFPRCPACRIWLFPEGRKLFNVATKEGEYSREPGGRPQHFHEKSHGESFLAVAQNSFRANGLYLLDEPEAALILQCLEEGLYPSWDAQNMISVHLAEKLGYELDYEYMVYEVASDEEHTETNAERRWVTFKEIVKCIN